MSEKTEKNTEKNTEKTATSRLTFNIERCKACGLCVEACPRKLLELDTASMNSKGLHPARITDQSRCIACALCAMMCPDTVITVEKI